MKKGRRLDFIWESGEAADQETILYRMLRRRDARAISFFQKRRNRRRSFLSRKLQELDDVAKRYRGD